MGVHTVRSVIAEYDEYGCDIYNMCAKSSCKRGTTGSFVTQDLTPRAASHSCLITLSQSVSPSSSDRGGGLGNRVGVDESFKVSSNTMASAIEACVDGVDDVDSLTGIVSSMLESARCSQFTSSSRLAWASTGCRSSGVIS